MFAVVWSDALVCICLLSVKNNSRPNLHVQPLKKVKIYVKKYSTFIHRDTEGQVAKETGPRVAGRKLFSSHSAVKMLFLIPRSETAFHVLIPIVSVGSASE